MYLSPTFCKCSYVYIVYWCLRMFTKCLVFCWKQNSTTLKSYKSCAFSGKWSWNPVHSTMYYCICTTSYNGCLTSCIFFLCTFSGNCGPDWQSPSSRTTDARWSLFSSKSQTFGLRQIYFGAFGVFSADLSAPILVLWVPWIVHMPLWTH